MIRDGRAVASSLSDVHWWDDLVLWWTGETPRDWERAGKPRLELCALHWKRELLEVLDNQELLDRYVELRYEDLVTDTRGQMRHICEAAELEWSRRYERLLPTELPSMNHKWRARLSAAEQAVVVESVGDVLEELGYLPETGESTASR